MSDEKRDNNNSEQDNTTPDTIVTSSSDQKEDSDSEGQATETILTQEDSEKEVSEESTQDDGQLANKLNNESNKEVVLDSENTNLDESQLSSIKDYAKANGYDSDRANKLLSVFEEMAEKGTAIQEQKNDKKINDWRKDSESLLKQDGDYETNVKNVKAFYDQFKTPSLSKALESSGIGNHPDFIAMMMNLDKTHRSLIDQTKTDSFSQGSKPKKAKSMEEIFYGNMKKS